MAEATKNGNGTAVVEQKSMLLLDLGTKSKKNVRRLRKGRGKLLNRINSTIEDLKADGEIDENSQVVVVVVKQRDRKRGWW
ncbi:MAG: hypothetical protein KDI07_04925 [Anaerolineae bacterium]|nr:hypothetical protein [Anaerolineae bacterium]MCB9129677.1 hypothetical protein [Anaerolineales bacterium]MCB0228265.1 hypothetical protein [Anaerolineae bacterium]MCB0235411.1 hypothetical protein [Anaerolineae bacterium]MCB0246845.1 hypothetical protein [Anaerolineae bacterium]